VRSNTPLQALTLLNDAVFVECAQAMSRRIIKEAPSSDPKERLRHALRLCMAREPTSNELEQLTKLHGALVVSCRANAQAAEKLVGPTRPEAGDLAEAAAWVALARTVLNLDEFVTRE
jgi:hypothetical protein